MLVVRTCPSTGCCGRDTCRYFLAHMYIHVYICCLWGSIRFVRAFVGVVLADSVVQKLDIGAKML